MSLHRDTREEALHTVRSRKSHPPPTTLGGEQTTMPLPEGGEGVVRGYKNQGGKSSEKEMYENMRDKSNKSGETSQQNSGETAHHSGVTHSGHTHIRGTHKGDIPHSAHQQRGNITHKRGCPPKTDRGASKLGLWKESRYSKMKLNKDSLSRTELGFSEFLKQNNHLVIKGGWRKEIVRRK